MGSRISVLKSARTPLFLSMTRFCKRLWRTSGESELSCPVAEKTNGKETLRSPWDRTVQPVHYTDKLGPHTAYKRILTCEMKAINLRKKCEACSGGLM